MKKYLVGGAVRDILLGQDPKDKDYVVVGSTVDEMLSLGFDLVGQDFPVFLHPKTGEEYALARKERKTGNGYQGFSVDFNKNITLEDDLFRRDLTINAMAMNDNNEIIDYFNGQQDLKEKTLRHVSIHFKEDPVRILRICRFAARYEFKIADETKDMIKEMIAVGEFDHLTKERVYLELKKAMSEKKSSIFWNNLNELGALPHLAGFNQDNLNQYPFIWKKLDLLNSKIDNYETRKIAISFLLHDSTALSKAYTLEKDVLIYKNRINEVKDNINNYINLESQEKLNIIRITQSLHNNEIFMSLFEDSLILNDLTLTAKQKEDTFKALKIDIDALKNIDYELISKTHKKGIKEVIFNEQIKALNNVQNFLKDEQRIENHSKKLKM
jgi:tRNA nucleotidyltransferase/poly(A) polymerase